MKNPQLKQRKNFCLINTNICTIVAVLLYILMSHGIEKDRYLFSIFFFYFLRCSPSDNFDIILIPHLFRSLSFFIFVQILAFLTNCMCIWSWIFFFSFVVCFYCTENRNMLCCSNAFFFKIKMQFLFVGLIQKKKNNFFVFGQVLQCNCRRRKNKEK